MMLRSANLCAPHSTACRAIPVLLSAILLVAALNTSVTAGSGKRGVLLLTNGRVIGGHIDLNAGGYMVRSQNGSVFVPIDRVRLRAADIHDVYRRLLSTFPNPSPATHLALAHWCLTQQLYDETKIELRSALKMNPDYAEARNMLRRLDEILAPKTAPSESETKEQGKTGDGFTAPPASSLAGLPRETAREFVTKVQPLMMNRCALGGCHATGGPSHFNLARVRIGPRSSRSQTEQNLAAVLRYLDQRDADGSRLLTAPRGNHGRGGRPVFVGHSGTSQFQMLRKWVRQVVAANPAAASARLAGKSSADGSTRSPQDRSNFTLLPGQRDDPTNKRVADLRDGRRQSSTNSQPDKQTGSKRQVDAANNATGGDPLLDAILREERRDAFDPAEFNRQSTPR